MPATMTRPTRKLAAPAVIRRRVAVPHGVCRLTLTINGVAYAVIPNRGARAMASRASGSRRATGRSTTSPRPHAGSRAIAGTICSTATART